MSLRTNYYFALLDTDSEVVGLDQFKADTDHIMLAAQDEDGDTTVVTLTRDEARSLATALEAWANG